MSRIVVKLEGVLCGDAQESGWFVRGVHHFYQNASQGRERTETILRNVSSNLG